MSTVTAEQTILDAVKPQLFIGGEWRDAAGAGRCRSRIPSTGETLVEVADATVEDAKAALDAAVGARRVGDDRAARARRDPAPRLRALVTERADDLALLMTLEMGKPVAESKAEIPYAADFLHWFSGEAMRIDGRFTRRREGAGRVLVMQAAGRPVRVHHAVELPDGHGHPQDRPRHRGRLHDGRQAGQADAAVDARARPDPRGGRAARRRAQRHHREVQRARSWSR